MCAERMRQQMLLPGPVCLIFSVIYSFDLFKDDDGRVPKVADFKPPKCDRLWQRTEGDEQGEPEDGQTVKRHRKYCAVLTRREFDAFLACTRMYAESTETGGSIGAPGFGYGWAPAIAFRRDAEESRQNAYVTPMFARRNADDEWEPARACTESDWRLVRRAILNMYAD